MSGSAPGAKFSIKCVKDLSLKHGFLAFTLYTICVFISIQSVIYSLCVMLLCVIILTCSFVVQHVGDLGNIVAGPDGRASFRLEDSQLKVTAVY